MTDYLSPQWEASALVVVDVQCDFLPGGAAPIDGTAEVLDTLESVVRTFREAGRPIMHVIRLYEPGGSDVDLLRRDAIETGASVVAPGTTGAEIPEQLLPGPAALDIELLLSGGIQALSETEAIIFKPRWSAFYRTDLEQWLRKHGATTVVVAGCNLPNCPRATLFDASERDFRTVLVTDAVSGVTEERLADLERIGVVAAEQALISRSLAPRERS
jgi:nicotinamidase-related amidase